MEIIDNFITSTANRSERKLVAVDAIVAHWTANMNARANADAHRRYFDRPFDVRGSRKYEKGSSKLFRYASAHYVVDSDTIIHCIPDDEVAWHVGDKAPLIRMSSQNANYCTIGVEMCVNKDGDYLSMMRRAVWLFRKLLRDNEGADLLRHYDITGKACPRMYLPAFMGGDKCEWAWDTFCELIRSHDASFNFVTNKNS